MKYQLISKAYKVLTSLKDKNFNLKTSYNIYKLIKQIQPSVDFEIESIKKIFDKYNIQFDDKGQFSFDDKEKEQAFIKEYNDKINELLDMDIDLEFTKFDIPLTENIELTPADIDSLEPFINFI